ncbi:MAG: hypothetical protein C5B53_06025 [Candidatus Melainabacteria bacterium]|nr:MAG: hypothetical protein C5B53_06025 [Candidatus Melainabacteria bacterium]
MSQPDTKSIEELITGFYHCFQFEPGRQPDYEELRKIFHPQARITPPIADTAGTLRSLSLDGFLGYCRERFKDVVPSGGKESQLSSEIKIAGNVAQVHSRYEFVAGYAGPTRRGTNCFQLVSDANRWWVMALTWDRDKN